MATVNRCDRATNAPAFSGRCVDVRCNRGVPCGTATSSPASLHTLVVVLFTCAMTAVLRDVVPWAVLFMVVFTVVRANDHCATASVRRY